MCAPWVRAKCPECRPASTARADISQRFATARCKLAGLDFNGPYRSLYPVVADAYQFGLAGMNAARIPFKWEALQPTLRAPLAAEYVASITNLTAQLLNSGWFVLLDLHSSMRYNGTIMDPAAVADVWGRLTAPADPQAVLGRRRRAAFTTSDDPNVNGSIHALALAYPEMLAFDVMNEPYNMPSTQMVANLNAGVAAIRGNNLTNMVFLEGNNWSGLHSWMVPLSGNPANAEVMLPPHLHDPANNTVINVHNYLDADSSGTHPTCIEPGSVERTLNWTAFVGWLRQHQLRAFLSEFNAADNAPCRGALQNLLNLLASEAYTPARGYGFLGYTAWAAGHAWGTKYMLGLNPGDKDSVLLPAVFVPHLQPQCDGFVLGFNNSVPGMPSGYSLQAHTADWSRKATLLSSSAADAPPRLACVPAELGSTVGLAMYDMHGKQYTCPGTFTNTTLVVDLATCG